jgi:predicted CXXCH cytochrome family protein
LEPIRAGTAGAKRVGRGICLLPISIVVALAAGVAIVVLLRAGAAVLAAQRVGRVVLLVGLVATPLLLSAGNLSYGVAESSQTRFCLSCHEMQRYGKSLFVDDKQALSAVHYQNRLVERDSTCYSCHKDYGLFGDAKAKLNGLRHVWAHYVRGVPEKIALYKPFPNANCLHYAGPLSHMGGTQCTSCHDPGGSHHTFQITDAWDGTCRTCHADADGDPKNIRLIHTADYDGDGSVTEPLAAEIAGLAARVLAAMQAVAAAPGICYSPDVYPYFFKDTDGNKTCGATETVASNGFTAWTPALVKGSFNYQLSQKEPGAWAHNFDYIAQLLYDSVADLGGNVTTLTRP